MWSEIRRPEFLDAVAGHLDVKQRLQEYLRSPPYNKVLLLHGPPGIGKTTLALAAARSCNMEPLEINASQSMRSHADVERLVQSSQHTMSITSLMRGDRRHTCIILDEIDGSDPHAQRKLMEWMTGDDRRTPVLLTCNEIPCILKHKPKIEIVRCYPPKPADLVDMFPRENVPVLAKKFKHDVRRILQYLQYGESDVLPTGTLPTDCCPEVAHILRQKLWVGDQDPIVLAQKGLSP